MFAQLQLFSVGILTMLRTEQPKYPLSILGRGNKVAFLTHILLMGSRTHRAPVQKEKWHCLPTLSTENNNLYSFTFNSKIVFSAS